MVEEKLRELVEPDYGLELRDDFVQALDASIASRERIPFDEVRKRLGLTPSGNRCMLAYPF